MAPMVEPKTMTAPQTLLAAGDLRPKKQLGQNFLTQPATAAMIVARSRIGPDDVVLEIGAGLGALTLALAKVAKTVYAVETDAHLIGPLRSQLLAAGRQNVKVIHADALALDWMGLAGENQLVVAGNLPYHITAPIVVRLIAQRRCIDRAVIMVQKEMALRLGARPGGKDYGRLSVLLQYAATVEKIADLGAGQFYPQPKIDSQVIRICFRPPQDPIADCEVTLSRVVQAAFAQRRKTLRNSLQPFFLRHRICPTALSSRLSASCISLSRRPETLSVMEFDCLAASAVMLTNTA